MADALRIATRRSPLALWQTEFVAAALRALHPGVVVELLPMSTEGDEILDRSLALIGGKGLFTKALERAMFDGHADLAVHSLKDVPATLPQGMTLAAVLDPADPRDALVSNEHASLAALPAGARVGSSSLRRQAQLRHRYPSLRFDALRGNVQTRLRRLDDGDFDAIILAVAGLERLGLGNRIREPIETAVCVPAIGQGVLAIECRGDDARTLRWLAALEHAPTRARITAERAVNARLHGSCHAPIAAHAVPRDGWLSLTARVGDPDGSRLLEARGEAAPADAHALGLRVGDDLLRQGAAAILAAAAPKA